MLGSGDMSYPLWAGAMAVAVAIVQAPEHGGR